MAASAIKLATVTSLDLGSRSGQFRAKRMSLGPGRPRAFLAAYSADFDVDPYVEMFFFPTDTLKLVVFTEDGEVVWKRDLGPGVIPGMHFVPICTADMDGDGVDEVYYTTNVNTAHPLSLEGRMLERLDGLSGKTTGQWDWPTRFRGTLSSSFRNFIFKATVPDGTVLITAQGTYADMYLQGWKPDMTPRWTLKIPEGEGARGAHGVHRVDIDHDSSDEFFWGERCLRADTGAEMWCAERETYHGHSDVNCPVLDWDTDRWYMYTCRESEGGIHRVNLFDDHGEKVWGALDKGHIDMGWVARLGDEGLTSLAVRVGHKSCGPDGRHHTGTEFFLYDTFTGAPKEVSFDPYKTGPVDLNGDGRHELVQGAPSGAGNVFDRHGKPAGHIEGTVAMTCKLLDMPGEQMLVYRDDGVVRIIADVNARDSEEALRRYSHPHYAKSSGSGLGGL